MSDFGVLYLYEITLLSNYPIVLIISGTVLYLYEITLLSNLQELFRTPLCVLYLYEITLLSNKNIFFAAHAAVLYLYEITLLSNLKFCFHIRVNTRKKRLRAAGSESDKCNLYLYFRIRTDQCQ